MRVDCPPAPPETADITIYAVGGGTGHALRGALIQRALWDRARRPATLVVREGGLPRGWIAPGVVVETACGEIDDRRARGGGTLVVDTFPDGWMGRFPRDQQRGLFRRRLLVARAVFGGRKTLPGTGDFDGVGSPYAAGADEWQIELPGSRALGLILRPHAWRVAPQPGLFQVVDPSGRCDAGVLRVFAKAAARAGRRVAYRRRYSDVLTGAKILFVGAGYHTFYEALREGADARFIPLPKRWDDQSARARRYGLAVSTPSALLEWLREGESPGRRGPAARDEGFETATVDFVLGEHLP